MQDVRHGDHEINLFLTRYVLDALSVVVLLPTTTLCLHCDMCVRQSQPSSSLCPLAKKFSSAHHKNACASDRWASAAPARKF